MWCASLYKNDNNKIIEKMQYHFYDYCISTIFDMIKIFVLNKRYCKLYFDDIERDKMREIDSFDHRLLQTCHDDLAAVFRYYADQGKYEKSLFEISNNEIRSFFDYKYVDTEFLDLLDEKYWFLNKCWYDFVIEEINSNYDMVRELAKATLIYSQGLDNRELRWKSSYNAAKFVKDKHINVPWLL